MGSADHTLTSPVQRGAAPASALVPARAERLWRLLALERNTLAVVGAMFLMALGENLWRRFLPKCLEALGAPIVAIGAYGSVQHALDGLYQYPGGWASDHYGRCQALLVFVSLAAVGYVIIAAAPAWPVVFVGLLFIMSWTSMASPTLFAFVGDALPAGRRSVGFSVQAILRRVPILVAPALGGALITLVGLRAGVRVGLIVSVGLALVTLAVVRRMRLDQSVAATPANIRIVWRSLPGPLRRLLLSDIFIRACDAMVDVLSRALCRDRHRDQCSRIRRAHRGASGDRYPVLAARGAPRRPDRSKAILHSDVYPLRLLSPHASCRELARLAGRRIRCRRPS